METCLIGFLSRAVLEGCERLPSPKTGGEVISKGKMEEGKPETGEQISKPISLRIPLKYWHASATQKLLTKVKWNCVNALYQEDTEATQILSQQVSHICSTNLSQNVITFDQQSLLLTIPHICYRHQRRCRCKKNSVR